MSLRKKSASAGLTVWTIAQLSAFYIEHRSELIAHAFRTLKDEARAEDVVQDGLIKVMLAAPELESEEHALSYMHRTIENLCIDIFRIEGRRPNLVVLDDASAELELSWSESKDYSDVIASAEDAAIVRQALAMLSPAERAALVMWEMEGRSTADIAAELGIKESSVRHTVSRARSSLRRVLREIVIDNDRGFTALDLLSITFKKASAGAKKSSKAALSLILVFFAFLGFNSMPSNDIGFQVAVPEETLSSKITSQDEAIIPIAGVSTSAPLGVSISATAKTNTATARIKAARFDFAGLDKNGIPMGFTVTDSTGAVGSLYITKRQAVSSEVELSLTQVVKTENGAANIFLSERIVSDSSGLNFNPTVSYGSGGRWVPLVTSVTYLDSERLLSGNYLLTAVIQVEYEVETSIVIPATASGRDLLQAPRQIITRLVLNPDKTQIIAQAVYVVERGV